MINNDNDNTTHNEKQLVEFASKVGLWKLNKDGGAVADGTLSKFKDRNKQTNNNHQDNRHTTQHINACTQQVQGRAAGPRLAGHACPTDACWALEK